MEGGRQVTLKDRDGRGRSPRRSPSPKRSKRETSKPVEEKKVVVQPKNRWTSVVSPTVEKASRYAWRQFDKAVDSNNADPLHWSRKILTANLVTRQNAL